MAVADDLEQARAALQMINPAPVQRRGAARGPGRRDHADRAPLRPQQLRGAGPRRHARDRRRGREPDDADARRPARHAGGRAGGHARMRRQRAPRDAAAADRRALGRLRRLDRPLDRRPACTRCSSGRARPPTASTSGSRAPTTARTTSSPVLAETDQDDLTFVRSLPLAHAADPAAEILIAYEMNGEPLGPDHGAPFRLIVPHWYAVASVKWLKRIDVLTEPYTGEFQTGHYIYEWPDRPHEPVSLMRVRARITDPAAGVDRSPPARYTVRGKAWSGTGPVTRVDVSLTGEGDWHPAQLEPPNGPYQWQDWSFDWDATDVGRHTLRARATDAAGNVQPEVPPWNRLGYGNNAIEVIYVDVR